ncbi:MAG: gamma carbonic anhydrase family protein [Bdellovibrionota bacterium]
MALITARGFTPTIGKDVFIAPSCDVIGDVHVADGASLWFNVTIRGDVMPIKIGKETNVQDGSVIHGTFGKWGTTLGKRVTIGHNVIMHGTTIGDLCLIGMGSLLMDGSIIREQSILAAGSLVTEGSEFPPGVLIMGRPAKIKRELNPQEIAFLSQSADNYLLYKTWYREGK